MKTNSLTIIGSGSWGTALAQVTSINCENICLWARNENIANEINSNNENPAHLKGIKLNPNICATSSLEKAMENDIILMVTPAQAMRSILGQMSEFLRPEHVLILCSKGIEQETFLLMSEVVKELAPTTQVAVLSGPNFAHEIAAGKPAATTLACEDTELAETLQNAIASAYFRPYITSDIIGTQVAGALKNVIAIACGVAKGLKMGESARASLVTRGLAEIMRLGIALNSQKETFLGLSGVGDMMLTCSSEQSRNFSLGLALGEGKTLSAIMADRNSVTEGVHTAKAAVALANRLGVDMPICTTVHRCINENLSISDALNEMLARPLRPE